MKRVVTSKPFMAVPWYLMAGYAYEVLDDPILSDAAWDTLCVFLMKNREVAETHRHHVHVDWDGLSTGTASGLTKDLPTMTKDAAYSLIHQLKPVTKRRK